MTHAEITDIVKTVLALRPRPTQVTQTQAAEMLGLSRPTVKALLNRGTLRLNKCGLIPIEMVDEVRSER